MATQQIGTVCELWRFPVKSMLGEKLDEVLVTTNGVVGDRAYAFKDLGNGRIANARKSPKLIEFRAVYVTPPTPTVLGSVLITMPDGRTIHAEDPNASEVLSAALGLNLRLDRPRKDEVTEIEIDPKTVFADVPVEKVLPAERLAADPWLHEVYDLPVEETLPAFTADTLPSYFKGLPGTFFDVAPMHVIATGTLEHLRKLRNGEGIFDTRRYRANIYVKTPPELTGFVEDAWLGGALQIGDSMRFSQMQPALRCVVTTMKQEGLPKDPGILRVSAQHHMNNVGVYGAVESPGLVKVGDPVFFIK
jgi:uncharacterized protein YcbX